MDSFILFIKEWKPIHVCKICLSSSGRAIEPIPNIHHANEQDSAMETQIWDQYVHHKISMVNKKDIEQKGL